MNTLLRRLSSTRFTLLGMALLAVGAALSYDNPAGLLIFHLSLLGIVVLAAIGRLTHMEAHIEMVEGSAFDPAELMNVRKGPWHSGELDKVVFVQGPYTVDYAPGMMRGPTRSQVLVPDGQGGWERRVVGDDKPLVLEGYRFYTTFNKGFAAVLTWIPETGEPVTGTIHMPSYPLFDFRQANRWTPPGGEEIKFWLQLETGLKADQAWTLDPSKARGVLVLRTGDRRVELQPGQATALPWNKFASHPWPRVGELPHKDATPELEAAPWSGGKP